MTVKKNISRVTIITPAFNSAEYISDNIKSIMEQENVDIEHIIVDGASSDDTVAIVRRLDPKAKIISEPDKGISDAFNKGLSAATGDVIAILNSDDRYAHKNVVSTVVKAFDDDKDLYTLYGKVLGINPVSGNSESFHGEPFDLAKMRKEMIVPHPAFFARKEVYDKVGKFSLDYKISMDYDYLLTAVTMHEPLFIDDIFTIFRLGGASTRSIYLSHREIYRIMRIHGMGFMAAASNLIYKYVVTTISILMRKSIFAGLLFRYRKSKKGF